MVRSTLAVVGAVSLIASVLGAPSESWARRDASQHDRTEVRADLAPCCGNPEANAQGHAERKTVSKSGSIKKDRFSAEVEIPIPSAGLGITDPTTADVRLILSRGGVAYAECFLVLDDEAMDQEGDDDTPGATAEFQVKVMSTPRGEREIRGQCDIDLATAGVQAGVPDVQAGDVATARVVDPSTSTPVDFLEGTFVAHH
jgi:hypothetical protein